MSHRDMADLGTGRCVHNVELLGLQFVSQLFLGVGAALMRGRDQRKYQHREQQRDPDRRDRDVIGNANGLGRDDHRRLFFRFDAVAAHIDREIFRHYLLYPCNYIALDILEGNRAHADRYTENAEAEFVGYLKGQLAKIELPDRDEPFLWQCLLTMYANPARNQLAVL